jgi:shikimate kinase
LDRKIARNFVLSGISGSGKSTVGRHLAIILGFGFLDLDRFIEHQEGLKIADIWKDKGESVFRGLELSALTRIQSLRSHVIALGGGAVQNEQAVHLVKNLGPLIWLKPSSEEIARRFVMRVDELESRPLLADLVKIENKETRKSAIRDRIEAMTDQRSAAYNHADIVLDGGFVTSDTSACQLKDILDSMGYIPELKSIVRSTV